MAVAQETLVMAPGTKNGPERASQADEGSCFLSLEVGPPASLGDFTSLFLSK